MPHLNGKRKKTIVWLVLWDIDDHKLDFIRSQRKGFKTIFCSDTRADAMKKVRAIQKTWQRVEVKLISAKVRAVR